MKANSLRRDNTIVAANGGFNGHFPVRCGPDEVSIRRGQAGLGTIKLGAPFVLDEERRYVDGERRLFRRVELRASAEQKDAIYKAVLGSSHIDIEYIALLTLAGLIAVFGLLENSSAVIIGATLISPLMN